MWGVSLRSTTVELRVPRTKLALIEAAKRLLAERAVAGFTIDDVVRSAGVARGTFYNHFATLDGLVNYTLESVQGDLHRRIDEAGATAIDGADRLCAGAATVMRYGYDNRASARVLTYNGPGMADPSLAVNTLLTTTLRQGIDEGLFTVPSIDAGVVAVLGICEVGLSRMLDLHHEFTAVRELTMGVCVMILRCVGYDGRRIERLAKAAVAEHFDLHPAATPAAL
jgi:AcrR family transcriptional regulator